MRKDEDQFLALSACYAYQQTQKKTIEGHEHTIGELQQVVVAQQKAIAQLTQMLKTIRGELDEAKASLKGCECKTLDKTKAEVLRCEHAICVPCLVKWQADRK